MTDHPVAKAVINKATNWIIVLSVALIILGLLALSSPMLSVTFITVVIGWITLTSGIVTIIQAFQSNPIQGFWLNLLVGIFYAITGSYILANPVASLASLTLVIGILLVVEGIVTATLALIQKVGGSGSWLLVINGAVTSVLGAMVISGWPFSALWLLGLYVGLSLLLRGSSMLVAALLARKVIAAEA